MNSRKLLLIHLFGLFGYCSVFAQVNFSAWSSNYTSVSSYAGQVAQNAYTFMLEGNGEINVPFWKISVQLKQPIMANGHQFPAHRLSFVPTTTSGQASPGPVPSINQIGMPSKVILDESQEVFLIPNSNAALYNDPPKPKGYYNLQLKYNFVIEGGSYLGAYPAWTEFPVYLEFKAYDQWNNLMGISTQMFEIQIAQLSGTPPQPSNQLSIQLTPELSNGLLELKTINDYIQGTSVTYQNAIKVTAITAYQIKVSSLQPQFTSNNGQTLPLNLIQLSLMPASGNAGQVFPVWLAASPQKIASGSTTQGVSVFYDLSYKSKPNDNNLLDAKPDQYSTTLQYEILPQ